MKEAPGSSETSVLTRATRRNNPEDTILHSRRREILKSYIGTTLAATSNRRTLRRNISWHRASVASHRRENLKSYKLIVSILTSFNCNKVLGCQGFQLKTCLRRMIDSRNKQWLSNYYTY
jgi:hypothetical protein